MKIIIDGKLVDAGSGGGGATPPLTDVLTAGNTIAQSQSIVDYDNNGAAIVSYNNGWSFSGKASSAASADNVPEITTAISAQSTNTQVPGALATNNAIVNSKRYDLPQNEVSQFKLLDRTINRFTGVGSSVTFELPEFVPGKVLDLIVDVDNKSNNNSISISFDGYGEDFALASTSEDLSEVLTVEENTYYRCYITQCNFIVDSKPVLQVLSQKVSIPTPWLRTVITLSDESKVYIEKTGTLTVDDLAAAGLCTISWGAPLWVVTITGVKISPLVTTIGNNLFYNAQSLKSVVFSDSVTSIGSSAFYSTSLTSVTIPNSVSVIYSSAFKDNYSLTNVNIGSGVSGIGYGAFGCIGASTINIAKSMSDVQNMDPGDWFYCSGGGHGTKTIVCLDGQFDVAYECFAKGTKIMLSNGSEKNVEDLTYNDVLKVWDFDEGVESSSRVCWLTKPGLKNDHYYELTFSDGSVLKTTGQNSNHKIFNVTTGRFEGVNNTNIGDTIYSINGPVTVTDKKYIEEEVEYYNVMTSRTINCFAEGILASNRYSNLYPTENMVYVKGGRTPRPYSEYEAVGIDRYWYDNLRVGESTDTVEQTKKYIGKITSVMLPKNQD